MIIFLDTNILLDVLQYRDIHYAASSRIWNLCEKKKARGFISAISFNNVFYVIKKTSGLKKARVAVQVLYQLFKVTPLNEDIIRRSIFSDIKDFEDAIQYNSAMKIRAKALITRNPDDYYSDDPLIVTPGEFIQAYLEKTL